MPRHEEPHPWWKICENPLVKGASRLFVLFGVPVILFLLSALATDFRNMRDTVLVLNRSIIPEMQSKQADHESRIRDLEAFNYYYGRPTPGRH